ncbi:MAG: hypothetical protein AB1899_12165 [Pseudomonadota bacterium]
MLVPTDYGAYMTLWGLVEMMVPLTSMGMLEAVRRYLPDLAARGAPGALGRFVGWMTLARLAVMAVWTGLIAAFWGDIAAWLGFSQPQQDATLLAVGMVITVIGFRYTAEMLESLLEQRWSQSTRALQAFGRLGGVAALVAMGSVSLERVLWVDLGASLVCFLLAEFFLARKLKTLPGSGDYRITAREVGRFTWNMAGVNLLDASASFGALRMLVARFLGLEAAGLFAFLQQLLMIVGRYLPANLLANIIRPMLISRHAAGETGVVGQGMALMWKTNLLIILGCVAAFAVAGDVLISLASGGRFPQAGLVMLLLFLGLGATTQGQLLSMLMQIHERVRELRNLSVLFLLVPLAVWLGAAWDLVGVALGIVLSQWFRNSVSLWWLRRLGVAIQLDWRGMIRASLAVVAITALAWYAATWVGPWGGLAGLAVLLPLSLLLAKPFNAGDMDLLQRGLHRRARFVRPFAVRNKHQ